MNYVLIHSIVGFSKFNRCSHFFVFHSECLFIQRRIVVECVLDHLLQRLLARLLQGVAACLAVGRLQVVEGRVVAGLVSKLLHYQALDRELDSFDVLFDFLFSDVDLLVFGSHHVLFFDGDLVQPLLTLPALPSALLDLELCGVLRVWHYVEAFAVLLALEPLAVVGSAIGPEVDADSALPVVDVLADEHAAVAPPVGALAVHHVVVPVSEVEAVVVPHEEALAVEHVVAPFADVPVAVGPPILSLALLGGVLVEALILTAIIPLLFSEPMLLILVPVPNILAAVGMPVDSKSLRHIVDKLAFIKVTTCMVEFSTAIVEVVLPESLVDRAVRPLHDPVSLLDVLAVL